MADVHNTGDKKQTGSETPRDPQSMRPEKDPTEPMKHIDKKPGQRDGNDEVMEQWRDVPQGKQKSDGSGERT